RLRVVAGREGDNAAGALVGRQARQRVVGAAELECAGALEVLALEEQLGAGPRVDGARRDDRRGVRGAGDLARGALDVGESRNWHRGREPAALNATPPPTRSRAIRGTPAWRASRSRSIAARARKPRAPWRPD